MCLFNLSDSMPQNGRIIKKVIENIPTINISAATKRLLSSVQNKICIIFEKVLLLGYKCKSLPDFQKVKPMDYNNSSNPYIRSNNNYDSNGQNPFIRNPGQTMATVSLVLGIASIFTMLTVYLPIILGSLAIVLAILSKGYGKKMLAAARVGFGTAVGGMALILTIVGFFVGLFLSSSGDELIEYGREQDMKFERQTGQKVEDITGISYEDIMKMYAEMMGK